MPLLLLLKRVLVHEPFCVYMWYLVVFYSEQLRSKYLHLVMYRLKSAICRWSYFVQGILDWDITYFRTESWFCFGRISKRPKQLLRYHDNAGLRASEISQYQRLLIPIYEIMVGYLLYSTGDEGMVHLLSLSPSIYKKCEWGHVCDRTKA